MLKNCYYNRKRRSPYFTLYYFFSNDNVQDTPKYKILIVASKKGVHKQAVKRNFAKRRIKAILREFLKLHALPPSLNIKIVARKEILDCSFNDLSFMLQKNLKEIVNEL